MRVYRASQLGYSLESLVAGHLGFEPVAPPDFLQAAFDEGNRIEPLAIQKLRDHNWHIRDLQQEENSIGNHQIEVVLDVVPDVARVVGHLDGVGLPENGREGIIEIKCMADKSWQAFRQHGWDVPGLVQKYKWQASCYMLASRLPHYMVAWNKTTEELAIEFVEQPFYSISDIALKIDAAEKHISEGTLPEGCNDYPCPFFHLHAPSDNPVMPADEELEDLMAKWLSLDNFEKEYKREKDAIRAEMLAITGVEGVANVRGKNGVTVVTTWQEGGPYTGTRKSGWVTKVSGPRRGNAE